MIAISNSEMTDWQRCPRRWYLRWFLGRYPADEAPAGNRQQGSRVHLALQAWTEQGLDPVAVLDVLYRAEIARHQTYEIELRREMEQSKIMVAGLLEWAERDPAEADLDVIAAEREVQVPLPGLDGIALKAKLDQVIRRRSDGAVLFRDWKTSANFDRHELLASDPQMRRYALIRLIEAGGLDPSVTTETLAAGQLDGSQPLPMGGLITTLRRCKRTATSTPPYYRSDPFLYTEKTMVATYRTVLGVCGEIMRARSGLDLIYGEGAQFEVIEAFQQERLRPNWMQHDCSWSCPFVHLCPMMDDGSDWAGALDRSGRYAAGDPYRYYLDGLSGLREAVAAGTVGTAREGDGQ